MSESKFKLIQQDVCYKEPEEVIEEEALDKICPTCIPNQNYTPPDWTKTTTPYLNELKCEYQVKVMINIDADIYYDREETLKASTAAEGEFLIGDNKIKRSFRKLSTSPYELNVLLKSYIRPGVRKILRHFGKLETDEIVCASPPEEPGQVCKGIHGLDYEQYVSITEVLTDEPVPQSVKTFEVNQLITNEIVEINNEQALELVARVKDYSFITSSNILVVHIGVPAYRVDAIPDKPDLGSLNTSTDKIVIKPPEFMDAILRFKAVMQSYKTFQSYFYREENGFIFFEETQEPFYIKFYAEDRIDRLINKLDKLLNLNNFDLRGALDTGTKSQNIAFEVEVSFDKSNEKTPFAVKTVRARKVNCPFVDCKVGLEEFIEYSKLDQTIMGYFSDIMQIRQELSSNVTPPWLDFIVSKTYPQLSVNYGSSGNLEDNSCLSVNLQDAYDFVLNETMDLFKSIEYQFNSNKCKTSQEILAQRERTIGDLFSGTEESKKKVQELNTAYFEKISKYDFKSDFKEFKEKVSETPEKIIEQFIAFFTPCSFASTLGITLKCLSAGLTLDEMYYTVIKKIISTGGEQALRIIMETLPANKQQQIYDEVEKQFKDMPYPWEPGWEAGSLGKAVDRQARTDVMSNVKKNEEKYESVLARMEELEKQIAQTKDPYYRQSFRDHVQERIDNLQEQIDSNNEPLNYLQMRLNEIDFFYTSEEGLGLLEELETLEQEVKELLEKSIFWQYGDNTLAEYEARNKIDKNEARIEEINNLIEEKNSIRTDISNEIERLSDKDASYQSSMSSLQKQLESVSDTFFEEERARLEEELNILKNKKFPNDMTGAELQDYQNFANLSPEDQQEIVDKQKEKVVNVRTTPSDEIVEGTLGKALGNVQEALMQAYLDEIMKTATISELQSAYENIPGSDLLGKMVSNFGCPRDPLIYPPIESFLSTLTFDPCGTEKTRFSLPSLQTIPTEFNWLTLIGDAFYVGLKKTITSVFSALVVKAMELFDTELCKLGGNLLRGAVDNGFEGVLDSLICPDPKTNDEKDKLNKALLSKGAGGRSQQSYNDLAKVLSVSATQNEIKAAMVGRGDSNFLDNISELIKNTLPEFADVFADRTSAKNYFDIMGNLLTPEQRRRVINDLNNPQADFPVETSICLTKEERELWNQQRASAFSDPTIGEEFVNKQNEKIMSDVSDTVGMLLGGPDTLLENAINDAFNPKDPDCKTNKGLIPGFQDFPENRRETISNAITGIFKRLEKAFIDDTIEDNFFNPFNPSGILLEILSNTRNLNLAKHNLAKNNFFFALLFGQLGQDLEFPETVGIQLKNYIEKKQTNVSIGNKIVLDYDNEKENTDLGLIKIVNNFTSKIELHEFIPGEKIHVRDYWNNISFMNDNMLQIPEEYHPDPIEDSNRFKELMLGKMIQEIWANFSVNTSMSDYESFIVGMNNMLYNNLPKKFLERDEGQIAEGFLFGNQDTPILEETDLAYVNPEPGSTEYTYEEEEKVLGRSLTNNPRVHFLDPQKYGGSYTAPNIYIAEASHKGWLQFSKIIVPNPTGCDPKNSNFLMLGDLIKKINKSKQKIKSHELLEYDPTCVIELPFDKIANAETLATLEGIIRATIRVYLSDFLIRSFPIFSNVHLDVEKNYDNILLNYLSELVYKGVVNEKSLFASTYEGHVYGLLFLEQVVQTVHRKVRDNQMESNEEIEEILQICNDVQESHPKIFEKDFKFIRNSTDRMMLASAPNTSEYLAKLQNMIDYIQRGIAIIGSGGPDILNSMEDLFFELAGLTIERARFAAKINSINSVERHIKKLLKYVIKEELDIYTKKMREELEPRPWIYDVKKYLIGGSGIFLGKKNNLGVFDFEVPIGGGESYLRFGDLNDCPKENMNHALDGMQISDKKFEELQKNGGFFLEKYVVAVEKNRSQITGINGLMNLSEFKQKLNLYRNTIDPEKNISDYFGNATINEEGTSYNGSIGIKFGVRMNYIPPANFNLPLQINEESRKHRSFVQNVASFQTDSGLKPLESSKYTFPICSFEEDILDVKMQELLNSDENLNQELECYLDKLTETKNFKHLMDNVLQVNKIPSIYLIYSYINLIPSLGSSTERETDEDNPTVSTADIAKAFNDSKSAARSLFVSYYKNNDRDPGNEEENNEDFMKAIQRRAIGATSFINLGQYSWDLRRRIRTENPHDKDGNECQNEFGKLFKRTR